ncbi:MAG: hypothetical protein QMB07_00995, partial [Flavobacteriales bacterium]
TLILERKREAKTWEKNTKNNSIQQWLTGIRNKTLTEASCASRGKARYLLPHAVSQKKTLTQVQPSIDDLCLSHHLKCRYQIKDIQQLNM